MMFPRSVLDEIKKDALARLPQESCGLITPDGYEPFANVAEDPVNHFEMPPEASRRFTETTVLAVVHSHPDGPEHPTAHDQEGQIASGVPWGVCVVWHGVPQDPIFWGMDLEVPYVGRQFRWGPTGTDGKGDCLALIRDWYRREMGIVIPDTPRDHMWEEDAPNLYDLGWQKNGFRPVNFEDVRVGDGVLFASRSAGRPNHAGVISRTGFVLHHMRNRLSREDMLGAARGSAVYFLRPPS